ncbi:hypothetical protein [Pseudoalteromonas umbrosa]|uniref:hypothetical protein n=1 Tax=Pseudoalteromonas umbrosa TaxID=3048489 RepID=UPI0024C22EF9|nr:hypothetical protein [Pseudoalteromonas sp. B95]MDK1290073.1 hypothetical protein [Pseudoalteromonas sp. B95]
MAETFDIKTLIPTEELQRIAMRTFSPGHVHKTSKSGLAGYDFELYFHFYTGKMPSRSEFLYGMYFDQIGDTHKTKSLTLAERYLGHFYIAGNGKTYDYYGALEVDAKASGMQHPEGKVPEHASTDYVTVPKDPAADLSWMMDWSFSANKTYDIYGGNLDALRVVAAAGELVHDAAPTYVMISKSVNPPHKYTGVKTGLPPVSGVKVGTVNYIANSYESSRPLIMGSVGPVGSGAMMELASGYDLSGFVRPVSLRIMCNPVA